MKINWGFKEEVLTLLARSASLYESTEIQKELLTEAAAILWRLDDSVLPRTADELRELLPLGIERWVPEVVRLCYSGPLAAKDLSTSLSDAILVDLTENALLKRDILLNEALSKSGTHLNFREHLSTFSLPGVILGDSSYPESFSSRFYAPTPESRRDSHVYLCPSCNYPLDVTGSHFQCTSPYCSVMRFSLHPPHILEQNRSSSIRPRVFNFTGQHSLTPLAWRTLSCPLAMEKRMIGYFKKAVSRDVFSTITLCESRPGFSITENGRKITFELIATHSAPTLEEYYLKNPTHDETWLIVPDGCRSLFQHLVRRLPGNFKICTARSYSYTYAAEFDRIPSRGGRRIRCQ